LARNPALRAVTSTRAAACLVGVGARPRLDDVVHAEQLYARRGLLVVPGATMGYPGWFRVGYGHRDAQALNEALTVLAEGLLEP
jgi:aspartate/methionine/tyrosine aminotransferase